MARSIRYLSMGTLFLSWIIENARRLNNDGFVIQVVIPIMNYFFAIFLSSLVVCCASAESQTHTNAVSEIPGTDVRRWTPVYFSLMFDEDQKWMAPTNPFDVRGLAFGPVLTGVPGTVAGVSVSGLATAV